MQGVFGMFAAMAMMSQDYPSIYHEIERKVSVEDISEETKLKLKRYHDQLKIDAKNKHLKKFEIDGEFGLEIHYGSNYKSAFKKYIKNHEKA
jgi:cellulose synthase/poly-beta-1,6-N-acetylglucosamine synthase-like glycosyltransferase